MSQPITLREEIKRILAQSVTEDMCAQEIMPITTQAFDMVELVTTLKDMKDAGIITIKRIAPYKKNSEVPYYQLAVRQPAAQTPAPHPPKQEPAIMKETQTKGLSKAIMAAVTAKPGISLPDLTNKLKPDFDGITEKQVRDMAYHMKKQLRIEGSGRGVTKTYFPLDGAQALGKPGRKAKTEKQAKAKQPPKPAQAKPATKPATMPNNFGSDLDEVLGEIGGMLLEKNRKYGDSALTPQRIFSKASAIEQINVRLDDKLSRLLSGQTDDTEDVELDLVGYIILKRIAQKRAARA